MNKDSIELDSTEASDLRRWLSAEGDSRKPLSSGYQGAVYIYDGPDGIRIIKEALGSGVQHRIGRKMLGREFEAYQRVQGIPGIPRCFGMLDDQFLVLEYVEGKGLREPDNGLVDREAFFAELLEIIKKMHLVGVTHNDLKRKDNILVTMTGQPVLLDFGLSYLRKGEQENTLFRLLKRMDYNSWIKIKYDNATEMITDADSTYYSPTLLERVYRSWRRLWRTITFRQWRKARAKNHSAD